MKNLVKIILAAWALIALGGTTIAQTTITNYSSKVFVTPGESATVGFNVSTQYSWEKKLFLIRAVSPGLKTLGVKNTVDTVTLSYWMKTEEGINLLVLNSNWMLGARGVSPTHSPQTMRDMQARVGAFSLTEGSADAAILIELPAGAHTFQVNTQTPNGGTVLVEVYEVPNGVKG